VLRSWLFQNKDWEIILLDNGNLSNYIDLPTIGMTNQALSDVIRINLVAKYGGVWVDATCFCTKPLDNWIYYYMDHDFFAFNKPGPERMISSWFIAGNKNSYVTKIFCNEVNSYWKDNPELVFYEKSRRPFLNMILPKDPQKWFNFFYTKVLKIHPYFWFHFLFEKIYLKDEEVKKRWDATPKISADIPHALQNAGLGATLSDEIKKEIDSRSSPLYKLAWEYDPSDIPANAVLNYLFESSF
jgi:hypothetical protein